MPGESISERIQLHIVDALRTVTQANGYAWDVGTVVRGTLSPNETDALPIISLMPTNGVPDYRARAIMRSLFFTTRLWIDVAMAQESAPALEALIADVQAVLRVDARRGGLAEDTREAGLQYLYEVSTETLAGADLHWQIDYKVSIDDPLMGA